MSKFIDIGPGGNDLEDLITSIVRHPGLYAGSSNFSGVAAFIQGFAFSSREMFEELREFNRWLIEKFQSDTDLGWASAIEAAYPESTDALREFGKLYEEFRRS
ncbi:MAG: hypothetical protein IPN69_16455 [Acidobacteria bacterium]|nr:hypothetical protein [Acidobacteriota bacterium]